MSRRIAIYVTPTPRLAEWRAAFKAACQEEGVAYLEALPADGFDEDALLLTEHPHEILGWNPTTWHVVGSNLEHAIAASSSWISDPAAAARYVANRMATADMLGRTAGARITFGTRQEVSGFRSLSIPDAPIQAETASLWTTPLAELYGTIPSVAAAAASFDVCWFSTPDGELLQTDVIELEGKARGLVTGPKIDMGPGSWRLSVVLEYRGSTQPTTIRIHLGGQSAVEDLVEVLRRPGVYELSVEQHNLMLASMNVDISLERSALMGQLRILKCEIRQRSRGQNYRAAI